MKRRFAVSVVMVSAAVWATCGPPQQEITRPEEAQPEKPIEPPRPSEGPTFEVSYSVMAEVLHMAEGISIWRRDLPRALYRAFDDRFGLDDTDKQLRKRFAFVRLDLWEKDAKRRPQISFAKPFGPEGLFPPAEPGLQARFWQAVLAAPEPAALRRGLGGIVEPADAEALAGFLERIAKRVGEIITEFGGYQKQATELQRLLGSGRLPGLLDQLGRFCGVDTRRLTFRIHPVWLPEGQTGRAVPYGDTIVLELPAGRSIGPAQVAQVVCAVFERILARVQERTKSLVTVRFVEKAGFPARPLPMIRALLDAVGYGLAAPLAASGPAEVPGWPGDAARQRSAEAMTKLLRGWLDKGKKLDGVFALKAAKAHLAVNPSRPVYYVDGSMVIAHEKILAPFKKKVARWAIWKFPLDKKYNFPRKLDYVPGRSVLIILTPKDLKELPARFPNRRKILDALEAALDALKTNNGVIITIPRESRGYIFVIAATGPKAMERVSKAFFELEEIPQGIVKVR